MRRAIAVLALVAALAGCGGGDDGDGSSGGDGDVAVPASTTTTAPPTAAQVRLAQVLLRGPDLAPHGYEPVVVSRPFTAQRATRILLCGQDVRAELRLVAGRQSRFTDRKVEVTHTVTNGGDTNAFLDRFNEVVDRCDAPWTEPELPTGGGPVTREITGRYPLPEVGVPGAGAIIRSRNDAGGTDTIVVVLVRGAIVSSLSVSGPVGSDFDVVDPAIVAAAERLEAAQSAGVP